MKIIQIFVGVLLMQFAIGAYAASDDQLYSVKIKHEKALNLRAWPSNKSKIIIRIAPKSKNILFLGKRKLVAKDSWMKVRWHKQEGWVNAYFLQKQLASNKQAVKKTNSIKPAVVKNNQIKVKPLKATPKPSVKPAAINRNLPSKKPFVTPLLEKPKFNEMERQGDRYRQPSDIPPATNIKTKLIQQPVRAVQRRARSKLSCRGLKTDKWKLRMNMVSKKVWLKLEDRGVYSLPITFSQWDRNSYKRMTVVAGKGRERIKAVLNRNHLCRRSFLKSRYTYSINATVSRSGLLSGCCADFSR